MFVIMIMLSEEPSPDKLPGGGKSYSAVISDIHLNDYRSQQGGWAWFDKNRDFLITFLDRLIENKDRYRELVLLGMLAKHFDGRQRGYIYANIGSWVDDDVSIYDTRSFVDLYYGKDGYIQVCVKQTGTDGSVKNLYVPLWLKK